jgi:hypothetical protein
MAQGRPLVSEGHGALLKMPRKALDPITQSEPLLLVKTYLKLTMNFNVKYRVPPLSPAPGSAPENVIMSNNQNLLDFSHYHMIQMCRQNKR